MPADLRISALLISLCGGYVLPIGFFFLVGMLIASLSGATTFHNLWLSLAINAALLICPFGAGYWAARLAQTSPLLHGLLVSLMGALLISLMTRPYSVNTLLFSALWFSALGVTGAWWWRRRAAQSTRVDGSLTK